MANAAVGDRKAFGTLTRRHLRRSIALAQRVVGNAADAEEVAQDAFLQIWANADRWRGDGTRFTTWLYRIVVNRAIDYKRRRSFAPLDDAGEIADPAWSAETVIDGIRIGAAPDAAIAALHERQRAALSLCYHEEMTCAEASEILQMSFWPMPPSPTCCWMPHLLRWFPPGGRRGSMPASPTAWPNGSFPNACRGSSVAPAPPPCPARRISGRHGGGRVHQLQPGSGRHRKDERA